MSEQIGGMTFLATGGHVWIWQQPQVAGKSIASAGIKGAYTAALSIGARPFRIAGREGARAVMKAADDAALNVLEAEIEYAIESGAEYAWQDDQGHSGTALVITGYRRAGSRKYHPGGVWQFYEITGQENNGGW